MKVYASALMALLMSLALTACGTLTTVRSVHVYPVESGTVVEAPAQEVAQAPVVIPEVAAAAAPSTPVEDVMPEVVDAFSNADLECMAMAIYHEARGEPVKGQVAVGWVILNRTSHQGYPLNVKSKRGNASVCDIVHDAKRGSNGKPLPKACQFSWYCDGRTDVPRDLAAYERSRELARQVLRRQAPNPVGRAIYFDGFVHLAKKRPTYGNVAIGKHRFFVSHSPRGRKRG